MPTILTNGIQLPDKGSVDWYNSMQSNYNLIDTHLGNTDTHVTAEDKANWNSKQGSLSQTQLDAIAQVATNTSDIATLQSGKANASHTHSSSDITDIGDYATKQYVDNSISGLVDSAPNALDTLKELSTALNDDANFASTVTTALSTKANSADLATVATSGSYNDLSNKPTINDSTITIQKNGSTVDTFTTNGSAKTINIPVPTKTSDLTNDSNFVDTSNSAVASGITSAKVTSYDSHVADTDIHVTIADKNKWNNGVTQSYVFRYSSTALVASSTNANSLLDNTDNLKVGDKVIDSNGVLFSITAIDTANSTFTVGTALIDLAQDSDVVHKSGNETINGNKTFSSNVNVYNSDSSTDTANIVLMNSKAERGVESPEQSINFIDKNNNLLAKITCNIDNTNSTRLYITAYDINNNSDGFSLRKTTSGASIIPTTSSAVWLGNIIAPFYSVQTKKINTLTPSSLSLPSGNVSDFIDISSYFSNTGSGDTNSYTALANGWIYLRLGNITSCQVVLNDSSNRRLWGTSATGNVEQIIMPILKDTTLTSTWVTNSTVNVATARFIPCQGNI